MADYGDILLEAVQTVVDGSISKLQFDKTIICNIVKNDKANKGEYSVSDGATTFLAYCDNTSYAVGQSVYVNIPNGDYSKQKMITGKYIENTSDYYTYTSPWQNFVDITGDLVADNSSSNSGSILANGKVNGEKSDEAIEEILLGEYKIEDGKDYSCIGLKADFKTWLSGLGAEYGTYGLRLYIRTVNKTLGQANKYQTTRAELSTLDMYGNPYAFETYYNQQKIFDVSGLGQICNIAVYLFQKNDFYDATNRLIEHTRVTESGNVVPLENNIFVNDIYLALGYSIEDFDGDMVKLYTQDPDTYSSEYGRDGEQNQKHLMARWIHKDEKNKIIAYTDMSELYGKARVHWYKYRLDQNVFDELAGSFWEEIPEWQDCFEVDINCFDHIQEQEIKYKIIIESPVKEFILRDQPHDEELNAARTKLDEAEYDYEQAQGAYEYSQTDANYDALENAKNKLELATEEYNLIAEKYTADVGLFESNELVLTNEQQVADLATLDLIQSLKLDVDPDGYKGIYTLYDQTNQIQNAIEANKIRVITANYKSTLTGDTDLDAAESITWMIPLSNTMIQRPEDGKEFDSSIDEVSETVDGQFLMIRRDGTKNSGSIGTSFAHAAEQYFRIKNYYTESATNNIITCYVIKNNKTYEASANLTFGPMGTNGTDFTFVLSMVSDRTCVFKQDTDPIQINADLYDFTNNLVPQAQNAKIDFQWWSQDNITKIGFCAANGNLYDSYQRELADIQKLDGNKVKLTYADDSIEPREVGRVNLLRKYQTDGQETCCFIRRLTDYEIRAVNGIDAEEFVDGDTNVPLYYILEASLTASVNSDTKALGKKILNTYLPIPFSGDYDFTQIAGTTKIVYDSLGTNPYYYKDKYKLYSYTEEVSDVTWDERNGASTVGERKFYPKVDDDGTIIPCSYFTDFASKQVAAVGFKDMDVIEYDEDGNGVVKVDENGNNVKENRVVWTQPILIIQNAYGSAMLNSWDGSLTIDEDKGTIMSKMIGAGYKDAKNRYNGVLMGDVKSTADVAADTGLFGYNEGVQSFGFKTDGTSFIGKSGKGQIRFDGNSGVIQSLSYKMGQAGMKIDLDDGIVDMRGNEAVSVKIQKSVDIIDVTDFTDDLDDIYCIIDDEAVKPDEVLMEKIRILQNCNKKPFSELTVGEINEAEEALNYIRRTVKEVVFKQQELQEYIEQTKLEYEDLIDANEALIENYIEVYDSLKDSDDPADQEDAKYISDRIKEIEKENRDLQAKLVEINNYNAVKGDIETFKSAYALQTELNETQREKDSFEELLAQYNGDLVALQGELERVSNIIIEYEGQTDENGNVTGGTGKIPMAQADRDQKNSAFNAELDDSSQEVINKNTAKGKLDTAKAELEALQSSLDAKEEKLKGYNNDLRDNLQEIKDLEYAKNNKDQLITSLKGQISQIDNNITRLTEENVDYANKKTESEKLVSDLRIELSGVEAEIQNVTSQLSNTGLTSEEKKALEDKKASLESQKESLNTQINLPTYYQTQINNNNSKIEELKTSKTEKENEKKSLENSNYDSLIASLQEEQTTIRSNIQTTEQEINALKNNILDKTAEVNALQREYDIALSKCISAKNSDQAEFLLLELTIAEDALNQYKTELQEYKTYYKEIESAIESLQEKADDIENTTLPNLENEILELEENYKTEIDNLKVSEIEKDGNIDIYNIIDKDIIIAELTALYNQTYDESDEEAPSLEDFVSDNLSNFTNKAYQELLMATNATSNLPTSLINSTVETPVYQTTRSAVRIATESPYVQITDINGNDLMTIADNKYYLQTSGYTESIQVDGSGGQGVKFDLKNGKLNGYNFSLKSCLSLGADEDDSIYNGTYISLSSEGTIDNPFFRVHYVKRDVDDNGNPLDTGYNVHLLDITRNNFIMHSQNWENNSSGIELNLTQGTLKAFSGFNLKAYQSGSSGNYIQFSSDGNPFFRIHYENDQTNANLNLMDVTRNTFILQSQNWIPNQSGLQIDLSKGAIKAFDNFSLLAKNSTGSYIQLSTTSSSFAFNVHYKNDNFIVDPGQAGQIADLDVLKITDSRFFLRSHDWLLVNSNNIPQGIEIDMTKGKLTAYRFILKAYKFDDINSYISVNSTDPTYPLIIKGSEDEFNITWDGKVSATYLTATKGGKIGPFNFDEDKFWTNDDTLGGSGVYIHKQQGFSVYNLIVDSSGSTFSGGKVSITSSGDVHINGDLFISGKIIGNNWHVDEGSAGSYTSGSGGMASFGNIGATGGFIGGWTIDPDSGKLFHGSDIELDPKGYIRMNGSVLELYCGDGGAILRSSGILLLGGASTTSTGIQGQKINAIATQSIKLQATGGDAALYAPSGKAILQGMQLQALGTFTQPIKVGSGSGASDILLNTDGKIKCKAIEIENDGGITVSGQTGQTCSVVFVDGSSLTFKNGILVRGVAGDLVSIS